jgi:hypothetical protein
MKEWLTVTSPKASWVELTKAAFVFVMGSRHCLASPKFSAILRRTNK